MKPFGYLQAASVEEALRAVAGQPGARFLGGGTNLVDLMKLGVERPELLVDVTRLPLDRIEELPDGGLRIGAMVRNSDLAAAAPVRDRYPVVSQALLVSASGQLRNTATTGGNLLQRTRCLYFQDIAKPCNKRAPGTGCPALDGAHRDLAVLGHSEHCVATQPSDLAVALAAVDATVHLHGPDGERSVPVTDFHRLPGDRPDQDTVIRPGELLTALTLPPRHPARARATARPATVPRTRSPWSPSPPCWRCTTASYGGRRWRSAGSRTGPGAPARPKRCCTARPPPRTPSPVPPTPNSPRPGRCATTASRSRSPAIWPSVCW